jgi:IclR-like helix-turn-helix domain-containing protein
MVDWWDRSGLERMTDRIGGDRGTGGTPHNDGRGVIESAFELLDHVGALEPVRLHDLAHVSGIPRETVRRLLQQLIAVGAVSREGTRYRLGASLLGLGARVSPERRLRVAARPPSSRSPPALGCHPGHRRPHRRPPACTLKGNQRESPLSGRQVRCLSRGSLTS